MPNGAECRTARDARQREMPESAPTTVRAPEPRALVAFSSSARRDFAPFGIQRSSEFSALRDFALFRFPPRIAQRRNQRSLDPIEFPLNFDGVSPTVVLQVVGIAIMFAGHNRPG